MTITALVFAGNESASDGWVVELEAWTEAAIISTLCDLYDGIKENGVIDWLMSDDTIHVQDTLELVGDNMAQIVADAGDGGMVYIVKRHAC